MADASKLRSSHDFLFVPYVDGLKATALAVVARACPRDLALRSDVPEFLRGFDRVPQREFSVAIRDLHHQRHHQFLDGFRQPEAHDEVHTGRSVVLTCNLGLRLVAYRQSKFWQAISTTTRFSVTNAIPSSFKPA